MKKSDNYTTYIANSNDRGRRLDRIVRKLIPDMPLGHIYKLIRSGAITVNGKHQSISYRVVEGDSIEFPPGSGLSEEASVKVSSKKAPYIDISGMILLENRNILALNKPKGISVHGKNSLATAVLAYLSGKEYKRGVFRPGPLHRLDRDTSGVILFSKSIEGARIVSALFREHRIRKYYVGLVEGIIERKLTLTEKLIRDTRTGMSRRVLPSESGYPEAKSAVSSVIPIAWGDSHTLVLCMPETGRRHQLRVQLAGIGHPLYGDTRYGGKKEKKGYILHAIALELLSESEVLGFSHLYAPISAESERMIEKIIGENFSGSILKNLPF